MARPTMEVESPSIAPTSAYEIHRVYYLDKPGTSEVEVEAPHDRAAAQRFFSHTLENERCRFRVEAKSGWLDYTVRDFDASEFMDEATRAALPPPAPQPIPGSIPTRLPSGKESPTAPIPGLAVAFRVLAVIEFIGGFICCCLVWPSRHERNSAAYAIPFFYLMAGIIFGCLFLAIADGLIYLRQIRDSLAQRT